MAAILQIDIITDASKATKGLDSVASSAGKVPGGLDKTTSSLSKLGKTAALAAGAAAVGGLVAVFKTGADEQMDFLAGQAQLEAGIKSTGNAAGVTVDGLEDLASSIQGYSGQTDDSIVASEKLLLTFTNLKNGVGAGNQVFDEATKMTADMAAKMGGDASKYAVQLGKALNDPTKGITSLTKIGVTFTDQQKKQIKSLQASGDTMGAQKVILAELRKEFGGAAQAAGDTLPGQLTRAKRSFEDVSQGVVAGLMPVLTALAGILLNNVMPAFSAVMSFISEHQTLFGIVAGAIAVLVAAIKTWTIVQRILNSTLLTNPIFLIIAGIIALGAALVIAYKRSATFRNIVQAVFRAIMAVVKPVIAFITVAIPAAFRTLISVVTGLPRRVASAGAAIWNWLIDRWRAVWGAVTRTIASAVTWIGGLPRRLAAVGATAWNWLLQRFRDIWALVVGAVNNAVTWIGGIPRRLASIAGGAWNWLYSKFNELWSRVRTAVAGAVAWVGGIPARFASAGAHAWTWLTQRFSDAWTAVKQAFAGALDWIRGIPSSIAGALSGLFDIITRPFKDAWDWVNSHVIGPIKGVWNGIASTINGVQFSVTVPSWVPGIGGKGWTLGLPDLPLLDSGGYITSATMAVIGERRPEIVAAEPVLRSIIRDELGAAGGGINITVNGALDPPSVARQIRDLLDGQERRTRGVRQVRGAFG